jgi:hypothetical protein
MILKWQQDELYHATGRLFLGLISAFSTLPDGNVPSSQSTEHRGKASAACPHVALSGLYQSTVIHSFITESD